MSVSTATDDQPLARWLRMFSTMRSTGASAARNDGGRRVRISKNIRVSSTIVMIRALLVDRDGGAWTPMAEIMLLYAARIMHVDGLIRPALEEGKIVLCDRFSDSTRAYQGYGHGMDMETIDRVDALSLGGFRPDLTFILDVPPREGLARAGRRQGREDRFERLDIGFHERLRAGYLEIAAREPQRCVVVDAAADADAVFAALSAHVMDRLQKTAPGEKHVRGI